MSLLKELREYANYLINLPEVKKDSIINRIIHYNIELLDSIDILIEKNVIAGVEELGRCYLENFFQLIFILKEPELVNKRALAYEYFFWKNKITVPDIKDIDDTINEHLEEYGYRDNKEEDDLKERLEKILGDPEFKKINEILNLDIFTEVRNEIERLESKKKKIRKFYECFSNNKIHNLSQLCNYIKYKNYYILAYNQFSRKIHGSDLFREEVELKTIKEIFFEITFDIFKLYCERFLTEEDWNNCNRRCLDLKHEYRFLSSEVEVEYCKCRYR